MSQLIVKIESGRTSQKKQENLICFGEKHAMALMDALSHAGLARADAEPVVEQLRGLIESGSEMARDEAGPFAIVRLSDAYELMDRLFELPDELSRFAEKSRKDFQLAIGHSLSPDIEYFISNRGPRKRGRTVLLAAADMAEDIFRGAEAVASAAVAPVFAGGNEYDQSLRDLCRAVFNCWNAATSRPLPKAYRKSWCFQCWDHLSAGEPNPLWVVMDALDIQICEKALNCLVAYANGEPMDSVRYD